MWENLDATILPYRLEHLPNQTWVATCKFCTFTSSACAASDTASGQVIRHAKEDDLHYDSVNDMYYQTATLARIRAERIEHRKILGSHEDTMNLNAGGL